MKFFQISHQNPFKLHQRVIEIFNYVEKERKEQENKDFIDKVLETNQKRQQQFQYQPSIDPLVLQQQQFLNSLQQQSMHLQQTPFLDQTSRNGTINQNRSQYSSNHFNTFEPQGAMNVPPYLQKFVAGPTRLESNPLSEPRRSFRQQSPQKQAFQLADYDLKNPDVQYERYKQMMQSQFYNPHANANYQGFNITGAHTFYQPPPPFNYYQTMPQQLMSQNATFNPQQLQQMQKQQQQQQQQIPKHPSQMIPHTGQIYHQPNTNAISLYSQPLLSQNKLDYPTIHPMVFRNMKLQSGVDESVIQSIGGIQDTIKPLQETLQQHELRPFHIQRDYQKDYIAVQKGKDPKKGYSGVKPENMKLVSVSPFRAVVKMDTNQQDDTGSKHNFNTESDEEEDEDFDRQQNYANLNDTRARSAGRQGSPIKDDSEYMRIQRDQFLANFNSQVNATIAKVPQQDIRSRDEHAKIKNQSQFMRSQRESLLNSFSMQRPSSQLR